MTVLVTLVRYKAWADRLIHDRVAALSPAVHDAPQPIIFGSIRRTLNHVLAMDKVWHANLEGIAHGMTSRNPADCPPLEEISAEQAKIDRWLIDYVERLDPPEEERPVDFTFIDGGNGRMTRAEVILHMVNHTTYHRGHIADMIYHAGGTPPTTDLPVYLAQTRRPRP